MSGAAPYELTHRPRARDVLRIRVGQPLLVGFCLAVGVGCVVALATQTLSTDERISAWFLGIGGILAGAYGGHRTWRVWPVVSRRYVLLRMDDDGVALRRGRIRDDLWARAAWSDLARVHRHALETPELVLHFLTFQPAEGVSLPTYPPGPCDAELRARGLSDAEVGLTFAHGPSVDADIEAALSWLEEQGRLTTE